MGFVLSKKSLSKLEGVHPDLVKVVLRAIEITETDFTIFEGLRSLATQKAYVARGASKTMNSKHLKQKDGFGHAVDIYPWVKGKVVNDWNVAWLSKAESKKAWDGVVKAMKDAAAELGVKIIWGGDWVRLKDGPHYQIEL